MSSEKNNIASSSGQPVADATTGGVSNWPPRSVLAPNDPDFRWERQVAIDLHNTLVNWLAPFIGYVNLHFGHNIDANSVKLYHMQFDPDNPLSDKEYLDAFVAFARRAEGGYSDLQPYDGVVEAIAKIKAAGIDVKIWTWTPGASETRFDNKAGAYNTGIAQRVTKALVARLGLDPDRDVRWVTPGNKKFEMAADHVPLIVEDSGETAVGVGQMGHAALLVNESYNQGIVAPNVLRLNDRRDMAEAVIDFFKKLDEAGLLL